MTDDPFAKLGDHNKPRLRVASDSADLECVLPVPRDAPPIPKRHPKLGAPSMRWTYLSAGGDLLGEVWRYTKGQNKEFRPLTLWRGSRGQEWRFQIWPEPRPLYGLDVIASKPGSPVVVCEGEKAADAAKRLLEGYAAVSWPGGSNAPAKADWTPLKGREVVIWPDADKAGEKAAAAVADLVRAAGAASVSMLAPPDGVASGWDVADAETEGWDAARACNFVKAARPVGQPAAAAEGKPTKAPPTSGRRRGVASYVELFDKSARGLFHDAAGQAYASVNVGDHVENLLIQSKAFANWLALSAYAEGLTPPNKATLGDTQRILEARALSQSPEKQPFLRVGSRGGTIYINMADTAWRVIEIGPKGWNILKAHDLPNVRSAAMLPMLEPQGTDESIDIFRRFVNADDAGFKLIVAWLLGTMCPFGPFPILILNGEQGSAKSTMTKLLRSLVDPNFAPLRAMPREESDLIVAAKHSHILAIDNASSVSGETSDALCRIATGGGMSARAKFTDGDEFVVYVKAPIVLNGIPQLAGRPDLASRSLIVRLNPIPDESRMTEDEVDAEWSVVAPRVLSVLLDALSSALARLPAIRPPKISRMADFERLVEAASQSLGWEPGEFSQIYQENQNESDAATIENEPLAGAVVAMIDDHPEGWQGTMARLLEILSAKVSETVRRSRLWPSTAGSLGMRLERLKPVLRRAGISLEKSHSGERWLRVWRNVPGSAGAAVADTSEESS